MVNQAIQSLWIGDTLSVLERLSIASFLKNGHEYHLYCYDPSIKNIPLGTVLKDANEILPFEKIFRYGEAAGAGKNSFAGFSNFFRYKLLLEKGGYWVDTDVVCLKPFDFKEEYVFSSELWDEGKRIVISSCLLKAPPGSDFLQKCWNACEKADPHQLKWGQTGPNLVTSLVKECNLGSFVKNYDRFCPIPFFELFKFIDPVLDDYMGNCYAVHFWNEEWRRRHWDKNATFASTSLYEQLKLKYL
jgi:hypothetical protein